MRLTHLTTALLIPALALAPAQTPITTAPTLKVYSRETIVDVTVTDDKGNPVHGLTQSDFTVKEDHKPQPIRSFHEYTTDPHPALPKLPPNTYTNLQPPPASSTTTILWLDFTNIAPVIAPDILNNPANIGTLAGSLAAQRFAKQYAMKYLQGMPPGTQVAVVGSSSPSSFRVLQGVTADPALLSAAVDTMPYDTNGLAMSPETWCAQQERRNRMTLESLDQIAADLAAIKGRKNLVWFTLRLWSLTNPSMRPPCLSDPSAELQKAYSLLATAQVTIYPVSVRGVTQPSPEQAADLLALESIAEATGGAAFYNNNDLASLVSQAIDKGGNYYTLSYVPPGTKYDWAHHSIDISVSNPDHPKLHLVYRKTYDAVDPATIKPTPGLTLTTTPPEVVAGNMSAAMSRSMPTSTDILFDVQVEPSTTPPNPADPPILGTLDPVIKAKLKDKPLIRYSFSYSIPATQLTFTTQPDGSHKGQTELDLSVFDTDGKRVTGLSQTVTMPLTDARYQQFIKGPFHFTQQLDLPPGQLFFLRIGVLDRPSNKVGTLEIPLTVPKK